EANRHHHVDDYEQIEGERDQVELDDRRKAAEATARAPADENGRQQRDQWPSEPTPNAYRREPLLPQEGPGSGRHVSAPAGYGGRWPLALLKASLAHRSAGLSWAKKSAALAHQSPDRNHAEGRFPDLRIDIVRDQECQSKRNHHADGEHQERPYVCVKRAHHPTARGHPEQYRGYRRRD